MAKTQFFIRIDGLNELKESFQKAGINYEPVITQAMRNSVLKVKADTRENLTAHGTSNTGNLRRSVSEREISSRRGVMAVGERYGEYVEYGRRPGGMPPVAAIERWAQTKLGASGLGFVIARKIARKGTKAQPFVEPAYLSNIDYVLKQFEGAANTLLAIMATG